jgi:hypothetical protein
MATLYAPRIVTDGLVLSLDAADGFSYASNTLDVEYLIVAGGGGGGSSPTNNNDGCGGGGAGGLLLGKTTLTTPSHSVVVGAGGTGVNSSLTPGTDGGNSSVFGFNAIGGGGGATQNQAGRAGGSGGGAGNGGAVGPFAGGAGVLGQGNDGGNVTTSAVNWVGAGGGGAGGTGSSGNQGTLLQGNGGPGISSSISGNGVYYAGGGGGGASGGRLGGGGGNSGLAPLGGIGGGADGGYERGKAPSGTVNTGGGGGGALGNTDAWGGDGGSGIVIIRYRGPQRASGGTVTTSNGWTIHTFTASGTFTVGSHIGDLSGNGNNGQLVNGPTFDSANGGSLVFDGIDDYATLGTTTILQSGLNSSSFSAWWKYLGQGSGSDKRGFVLESANFHYSLLVNTNGTIGVHINTTSSSSQYTPEFSPTQGVWYNSSVVWDGTNLIVYVNGQEVGRRNQGGTSLEVSSLRIGTYRDNNNRWWVGNISTLKIYNRALTPQEVLQNYNATKGRYGL